MLAFNLGKKYAGVPTLLDAADFKVSYFVLIQGITNPL